MIQTSSIYQRFYSPYNQSKVEKNYKDTRRVALLEKSVQVLTDLTNMSL